MCRGRRARILLHLHIQREKIVLRGSVCSVCLVCVLLQCVFITAVPIKSVLETKIRVCDQDSPSVANSFNNVANIYETQGKYEKALEMLTKSLDIKTRIYGDSHLDVAKSLIGIGSVLAQMVCVFYYCRTYYKAVRVGGGGEWRTCAMRDDEQRPVWMSLLITH